MLSPKRFGRKWPWCWCMEEEQEPEPGQCWEQERQILHWCSGSCRNWSICSEERIFHVTMAKIFYVSTPHTFVFPELHFTREGVKNFHNFGWYPFLTRTKILCIHFLPLVFTSCDCFCWACWCVTRFSRSGFNRSRAEHKRRPISNSAGETPVVD